MSLGEDRVVHHSKISCQLSALGHSRPMHSAPVPINVRCYSNSGIIVRRSAVTLRNTRVLSRPQFKERNNLTAA